MLRRITVMALFAIVLGVFAQSASADPVNAKKAQFFTAVCGSTQLEVVVNGSGVFIRPRDRKHVSLCTDGLRRDDHVHPVGRR